MGKRERAQRKRAEDEVEEDDEAESRWRPWMSWACVVAAAALAGLGIYAISLGETAPYRGPRECHTVVLGERWVCDPPYRIEPDSPPDLAVFAP